MKMPEIKMEKIAQLTESLVSRGTDGKDGKKTKKFFRDTFGFDSKTKFYIGDTSYLFPKDTKAELWGAYKATWKSQTGKDMVSYMIVISIFNEEVPFVLNTWGGDLVA